LLLVTLSEWGGAQHIVYLLAKHLQRDFQITVACAPGGELVSKLAPAGIPCITLPQLRRELHPWHDARAFGKLYRLLRRERFDLVHAHSTKAGLLGRWAARLAGVPAILFTAHGWAFTEGRSAFQRRLLATLERWTSRVTHQIICVSEHDRQLALRFGVARSTQLRLIHNGLDETSFFIKGADESRGGVTPLRPKGEGPILTFVGRLARPKEPLLLLDALQRLPRGRLIVVGDGPLRPSLEEQIQLKGLTDRVKMMGRRPDVSEILAASDIFVFVSRWEGLPLVIIEAMLAGLPVVATRVGGVAELVEDGVTGFLVPPGDAAALSQALEKLLDDEARRLAMGQAGRERALQRFTLERMLTQYRALYRDLCATRPA
jgi:glycosyltransferase involved in cell wall biosynthesis